MPFPKRHLPYAILMLVVSTLSIFLPQTGNPAIAKLAGTIGHPVHDTFLTLGIMELWMNRPSGHRRESLIECLRVTGLLAGIVLFFKVGTTLIAKWAAVSPVIQLMFGWLLALGVRPDGKRMDGFPSGHTCAVTMLAWILTDKYPKFGFVFYGLAALIGYSRWESNAHYGMQVLAGAILGLAVAGLTQRFRDLVGMGPKDTDA
ncbi:MAG: phosphatase PAP2 family protein [Armatimonadota bacterium]